MSIATTSPAVTAANTVLLADDISRKEVFIFNPSTISVNIYQNGQADPICVLAQNTGMIFGGKDSEFECIYSFEAALVSVGTQDVYLTVWK